MKQISMVLRALSCAAAAVVIAMFLFDFITVTSAAGQSYGMTGLEMCFGTSQTIGDAAMQTAKSAKYLFALILSLLGLVTVALSYKFKGAGITSAAFQLASGIAFLVYFCNPIHRFADLRPFTYGATDQGLKIASVRFELFFIIALAAAIAGFVFITAAVLIGDKAEALASNGARKTIPQRIGRWFKGIIGEIKKIVWPGKNTVFKNTVVVLTMCLIIGAFIWIVDFGFAKLLGLILGGIDL